MLERRNSPWQDRWHKISHPSDLWLEMPSNEMERLLECPGLGGGLSVGTSPCCIVALLTGGVGVRRDPRRQFWT